MKTFLYNIPKAELHIHIEGSLEPELLFKIAKRNRLSLPFNSIEEVRKSYEFTCLRSFLDIYYKGACVLLQEQDFYDLTMSYLKKAHLQNVLYAEIFFDPQIHTRRGIPFKTIITGIHQAILDSHRQLGITAQLIMCFMRCLGTEAAWETFYQSLPFKESIVGVGLDSHEAGNPPEMFAPVFDKAREEGFLTVAHAGEEGPAEYIWQALEKLKVSRIDHGIRCTEDPRLVKRLIAEQVPLTICPLSNVKLYIFNSIKEHNVKHLLDLGLCVTVNSDDPAYFGGYIAENLLAIQEALNMDHNDIYKLMRNSFQAAFLDKEKKQSLLNTLDTFMSVHKQNFNFPG